MSEAVDKLIEANQKASEQHRIAYGKAMYNQAISDAVEVIQKYNTGKELSPLFDQLIPKVGALLKPSQSPNQ